MTELLTAIVQLPAVELFVSSLSGIGSGLRLLQLLAPPRNWGFVIVAVIATVLGG